MRVRRITSSYVSHQPLQANQNLQFLHFTLLIIVPVLLLCAQGMQGVSRPQGLKDTGGLCSNLILGKEYAMVATSEPLSSSDGYTKKCLMGLFVALFVFIFLSGKPTGNLSHQDSTFCYLQATGRISSRIHDITGTEIPGDYRMCRGCHRVSYRQATEIK